MKKSEKIEIRVSVDEKEALSKLASDEGRSVSQLVRDVVKKYAALNMANPPIKYLKAKMIGLICLGLLGGMVLPATLLNGSSDPSYMVHGTINNSGFGFPLAGGTKETQTISIGEGDNSLFFNFTITDAPKKSTGNVRVSICQTIDEDCADVASADLSLNNHSPSVWQAGGNNGENIFLVIQPVES